MSSRRRPIPRLAKINYGYTQVMAPFDGVVTARLVSIGEYVGANNTPTKLATIVQIDPIWVNFNISEQDVLRIRAERARLGQTTNDVSNIPVEVGLQTDTGYPHTGHLDYAAPTITANTGTLAVRGIFENPKAAAAAGLFRARAGAGSGGRAVPGAGHRRSAAIRAAAICWCSMPTTWSSSARSRPVSMSASCA